MKPGYWKEIPIPAKYETRTKKVCVEPGRWEWRRNEACEVPGEMAPLAAPAGDDMGAPPAGEATPDADAAAMDAMLDSK